MSNFDIDSGSLTNTVTGTGTDNHIVRWDGTGAATIQDSTAVLSDAGALTGILTAVVGGPLPFETTTLNVLKTALFTGPDNTYGSLLVGRRDSDGPSILGHTDESNLSTLSNGAIKTLYGNSFDLYTSPATTIGVNRSWTQRFNIGNSGGTFFVIDAIDGTYGNLFTLDAGTYSSGLKLQFDSSGHFVLGGGATASQFRLLEPSGSGTNYTAFKAQAQGSNIIYTLPSSDAAGALSSDGAGNLSWNTLSAFSFTTIDCPSGTDPVADTNADTLVLAVGSGITITGDSSTDTITFANTGALNAFTTITTPAGTSPVADAAADTLTLTSTGITITGTAASDTIDFTATPTTIGVLSFSTISTSSGTSPVADSATDTLTLTGGTGITVTGSSAADSVTYALDINGLTTDSIAVGDFVPFADISESNTPNKITFANFNAALDHGTLAGLSDDDHTQYLLLAGRSGGQIATGGTASGDDLTLRSTTNATKGDVIIQDQGGNVLIGGGATASELRLFEPSGSGTNYTAFKAQAQAGDLTYTLPNANAAGALTNDGSGGLSWTASGNSFTTISVPNGTNPVADAATDTLTLTAGGGVVTSNADSVIITGTAGTDTIDFDVRYNNPDSGTSSERFGVSSAAAGTQSTAYGNQASAGTTDSVAIGFQASVTTTANGIAIGSTATSTGGGCAIGQSASATGTGAFAMATNADASGLNCVTLGPSSTNGGSRCVVIGASSSIGSSSSTTINLGSQTDIASSTTATTILGSNQDIATSSLTNIIRIGTSNNTGDFSDTIVIGQGIAATAANQMVIGNTNGITSYFLGKGGSSSAPSDIFIMPTAGSGTNIAGGDITIDGGNGTGTGGSGDVIIRTAPTGSSGTTANTYAERWRVRLTGQTNYTKIAGSTNDGDFWYDSTQYTMQAYIGNGLIEQNFVGLIFTGTADAAISGTASETTLVPSGVGTATLPANILVAGKTLRLQASGYMTGVASNTLIVRLRWGGTSGTVLAATGTNAFGIGGATNTAWDINILITCRTTGASGTAIGNGFFRFGSSLTASFNWEMVNTGTVTIDTTANKELTLTGQFSSGTTNTMTCTNYSIEILN